MAPKSISFTHLHVHSDASLLDGLGPVERLVYAAKMKGFDHLALTDHGTLANAIAFTLSAKEHGIKPIIGQEGYIMYDGDMGHITLLAHGNEGFQSLVTMNNAAHAANTFKRRPPITPKVLSENSNNVICLTGCVSSPLFWLDWPKAKRYIGMLREIFGSRLFAEIMFVADTDTWTRPLMVAEKFGLKHVITNDAHFPYHGDAELHSLLTKMKAGMDYYSEHLWLKNGRQMLNRAKGHVDDELIVEGLQRAWNIGQKIKPVNFKRAPSLPHISEAEEKLEALVWEGLSIRGLNKVKAYTDRLRFELDVITSMEYSTYFLILHDVISWARNNDVRVGPGRGSGAGSLILFLLGVTLVDPLVYDLSFERFLNPDRRGFPDVDIDFDSEGRGKVIRYSKEKWGAVPIATYSRYHHRSLVHDLAKGLRIDRETETKAAEGGRESKAFSRITTESPLFESAYEAFLGQIRHKGRHAGGVIITDGVVPVERAGDELVAAWTDGDRRELSYAGIVKFDFLGLTALSALKAMEDRIPKMPAAPGECEKTMETFRNADLVGIFQFSGSSGIADLTRRVAPTSFSDLVAINALYRPGALDAGSADAYPDWKRSPRKIHPLVDDILEETYGAIIYQEQVMDIFAAVTGGSLADADLARRTIVKSKVGDPVWEQQVRDTKRIFVDGAIRHGMGEETADLLWDELFTHVRYSFNRAHAVSYCLIAWELAWWKTHYPALFLATMMDKDPAEFQTYLFDAADHSLAVRPPHVNRSSDHHEYDEKAIYLPFSSIKYLGVPGAEMIIEEQAKGPFESFADFNGRITRRAVTSRARLGLYAVGGFDGLKGNPMDAGIDTTKLDLLETEAELQQKYLGAILPSAKVIKKIREYDEKDGWMAGVVSKLKKKRSKWGPYVVHYLTPDGVFWTRDMDPAKVGEIVATRYNKGTGRALEMRRL